MSVLERLRDSARWRCLSRNQICACCRDRGRVFGLAPYCPQSGHNGLLLSSNVQATSIAHSSVPLFCGDPQRTSTPLSSDTHRHPNCCLNMPLPENTTISLQTENVLHSKPKQAIFLRLSAEALEALQASPTPQVQFTSGKRPVSSNSSCTTATAGSSPL